MTQIKEIQGNHSLRVFVGGMATAGTDKKFALGKVPKCTITGVTWIPQAAVTGDDTNNFAVAVQNAGQVDGTATTAVTATKTYVATPATNSVAFLPEALTLSSTAANLDCADGDVLKLVRTHSGTGLAMPEGIIEITYKLR